MVLSLVIRETGGNPSDNLVNQFLWDICVCSQLDGIGRSWGTKSGDGDVKTIQSGSKESHGRDAEFLG